LECEDSLSALRQRRDEDVGRPWTREGTFNVIETVINLMVLLNLSKSAACDMVATSWHRRREKVLEVVSGWMNQREVVWTPPRPPGAASPSYPIRYNVLDSTHQLLITNYMKELNDQGQMVTAPLLRAYLRDKCSIDVSVHRIRGYLTSWGCTWDRGEEVMPVDKVWHERRIAKFIVGYAEALRLQEEGMYVIVYMDESYVHNNHAAHMGWFLPGSDRHVKRPKRIGRFVIFHAITKDGLLFTVRSAADDDLSQPTTNAEYIYHIDTRVKAKDAAESASNTTDVKDDKDSYHGNIDGDMFIKWLYNRLAPAFQAKYPGKKMILVMDNASYHNPHDDGWVPVGSMKKAELVAALRKYGITSFTAERERGAGGEKVMESVTFDEASFSKDKRREESRAQPVPSVDEMKKFLSGWLKQHPELIITRTRRFMQEKGWRILFTPPLEPRSQPIEELWGQVKTNVAQQYVLGRTMEVTRRHLLIAFYEHQYREKVAGDEQLGPGITARHCQKIIHHSHQWMETFIQEHSHLLAGTLKRLTFKNDLAASAVLSVDDEDGDAAIVDAEDQLVSEEAWDAAEWMAVQGIALLEAQWSYMGPAEEAEEVDVEGDSSSPPPRPGLLSTAAPALLVDSTSSSRLRPVVGTPRALVFA
jgi:hypothetical protein